MDKVARQVLWASYACQDAVEELYDGDSADNKINQQISILYEFVYCYLHLTMRTAFGLLTHPQIVKLQNHIGIVISTGIIESYFASASVTTKFEMTREFFKNVDQAELEYTDIAASPQGETDEEKAANQLASIFMRLGFRIAQFSDQPIDLSLRLVSRVAIEEWMKDEIGSALVELRNTN